MSTPIQNSNSVSNQKVIKCRFLVKEPSSHYFETYNITLSTAHLYSFVIPCVARRYEQTIDSDTATTSPAISSSSYVDSDYFFNDLDLIDVDTNLELDDSNSWSLV